MMNPVKCKMGCVFCGSDDISPEVTSGGGGGAGAGNSFLEKSGLSLCQDCRSLICSAVESKKEMELMEKDVRRRQMELLGQMRKLKAQVNNFKMWMEEVEKVGQEGTSLLLGEGRELEGEEGRKREAVFEVVNNLKESYQRVFGKEQVATGNNDENNGDAKSGAMCEQSEEERSPTPEGPEIRTPEVEPNLDEPLMDFVTESKVFSVPIMFCERDPEMETGFPEGTSSNAGESDIPDVSSCPDDESRTNHELDEGSLFLDLDDADKERQKKNKSKLSKPFSSASKKSKIQCSICGKWMSKNHINLHRRLHSGEKLLSCHICSTKFLKRTHYDSHMLAKHNIGADGSVGPITRFKCSICDKELKYKSNLPKHLRNVHGILS